MSTKITSGITHAGIFHADDIFSTALLRIMNPEIEISRAIVVPEGINVNSTEGTVVYDIGDGIFDHHHGELTVRENGIPKAAFGLLWEHYGRELVIDEAAWQSIDDDIVSYIDRHDNGYEMGNPLSVIFGMFNPFWDEPASADVRMDKFITAVTIAEELLKRAIDRANSTSRARNTVREYYNASETKANKILVMERFAPWKEWTTEEEVHFCVYPSERGGWCIQSYDSSKYPLPEEWVTNLPEGMTFCHKGRFLAAVTSKELAVIYALKATAALGVEAE